MRVNKTSELVDELPGIGDGSSQPWPAPPRRRQRRWYHVVLLLVLFVMVIPAVVGGILNALNDGDDSSQTQDSPTLGECVDGDAEDGFSAASCSRPHDFEVFAVVSYPGSPGALYPGRFAVMQHSNESCLQAFHDAFDGYLNHSRYAFAVLEPSLKNWQRGDHTTVCMVTGKSGQLTGPTKGLGASPRVPGTSEKMVNSLSPGDCYSDVVQGEMPDSIIVVSCKQPHNNEVVATFDEPRGPYPGSTAVDELAKDRCAREFRKYVGTDFQSSRFDGLIWFSPAESDWRAEDRRFVCGAFMTIKTTGTAWNAP